MEARWPTCSGRASDSVARDRGFDPHSGRRVVSLSKIHLPPKSTGNTQKVITRKQLLRLDRAEKLLTGTLSKTKGNEMKSTLNTRSYFVLLSI